MFTPLVSGMEAIQQKEVGNIGCILSSQPKEQDVVLGVTEGTMPKSKSSALESRENIIQSPLFI